MIKSLHITNYALIESIDIDFDSRFNIITGETGAGKSIILSALSLLQGERAEMRSVRDPSTKTIVEAVFDIAGLSDVNPLLEKNDIDVLGDTCIIRRELTTRGGSRAFINDTPVTLALLREVSGMLLDIHTQHENRMLTDNSYQLRLIDALAGNGDLLAEYRVLYRAYRKALKEYVDTRDAVQRVSAESEYLSFQLSELEALNLVAGEQKQLERDREILANVSEIKAGVTGALDAITEPEDITVSLARCMERLASISDYYEEATQLSDRLQSVKIELGDILDTIRDYDSGLVADPRELENIEERLGRIYSLETKHHVDSDAELVALRDRLAAQLDAVDNSEFTLGELEKAAKAAKKAAVLKARELTSRRAETAAVFAAQLKERAVPMGMDNMRCEVVLSPVKLGPDGADTVEFMFAFNKNQALMPVGKTASGGEISRVVLAIKSIVADRMRMPTMIFDEIDTGVSGDISARMATLMKQISADSQVITITHLPTVAARGNVHFKVFKHDDDSSTVTRILRLTDEERVSELAQMLSGSTTETALAAARALINN